jgi:urease accessory protein
MRASVILPAGTWNEAEAADVVVLDFDARHRRRAVLCTAAGRELLLDLPHAAHLRHGDGLALDEGGVVRIEACPEPLEEIEAHAAADLVRIAWHLGNRHLPVQLLGGRIRIRRDPVIAAMVVGLGGHIHAIEAPFDPESGAYAAPHGHDHG